MSDTAGTAGHWRLRIRTQYMLVVVASIVVVATALMVTAYVQARRTLVGMATDQMRQVSTAVDVSMGRFFSSAATATSILSHSHIQEAPRDLRAKLFFEFAEAIMATKPEIFAIKVATKDGTLLRTARADAEVVDLGGIPADSRTPYVREVVVPASAGEPAHAMLFYRAGPDGPWTGVPHPAPHGDPRDAEWYRRAIEDDGPHWSRVYRTVGGKVPGITRSVAYTGADDKVLGVLGADLRITDLARQLKSLRLSENARLFVAAVDGRLIAHPELAELEQWPSDPSSGEPWLHVSDIAQVAGAGSFDLDRALYENLHPDGETGTFEHNGDTIIGVAVHLGARIGPPGVIYFGTPVKDFMRVALQSQLVAFAVALLFVAGLLALVPILARFVASPIERLTGNFVSVERNGLGEADAHPGSRIHEIDEAGRAFNSMIAGLKEKELIRDLFGKYVPAQVAAAVIAEHGTLRPVSAECTIVYADLEGFTAMVQSMPPREVFDVLNAYFTVATSIVESHGGVVTQFQGDAILATFNVPVADPRHAENALEAAIEIQLALDEQKFAGHRLRARAGVNTGEVVAGNVGAEGRFNYTVHGDAVNTAARLEQLNKELGTRILVSETTQRACGDPRLRPAGEFDIRGRAGKLRVFSIDPRAAQHAAGSPVRP